MNAIPSGEADPLVLGGRSYEIVSSTKTRLYSATNTDAIYNYVLIEVNLYWSTNYLTICH